MKSASSPSSLATTSATTVANRVIDGVGTDSCTAWAEIVLYVITPRLTSIRGLHNCIGGYRPTVQSAADGTNINDDCMDAIVSIAPGP